jgi:hypothetical protein
MERNLHMKHESAEGETGWTGALTDFLHLSIQPQQGSYGYLYQNRWNYWILQ